MAPRGDDAGPDPGRWRDLRDPETLRLFVRNLGEGVYITSPSGEILDANAAALRILGVERISEIHGLNAHDLLIDPEVRRRELEVLEREGRVRDVELELRGADGSIRTVLDSAYQVVDDATGEVFYHGILVDITARKALERQLEEAAVRDQLTGCFNRRYLAGLRARLEAGGTAWGVVVIDVDHFKQYNDRHGHLAGDAVLSRLARFLMAEVRGTDAVVRFGGDEFLVVLTEDANDATPAIAERLARRAPAGAGIGFSLGWSVRRGDEPLERTIFRADEELYSVRVERRRSTRRGAPETGADTA